MNYLLEKKYLSNICSHQLALCSPLLRREHPQQRCQHQDRCQPPRPQRFEAH